MQADWCRRLGSPLYGAILEHAVEEFEHDRALTLLCAPYRDEGPSAGRALRLLAGAHRLALAGAAPALAAHFPSCGGDADADAACFCSSPSTRAVPFGSWRSARAEG